MIPHCFKVEGKKLKEVKSLDSQTSLVSFTANKNTA